MISTLGLSGDANSAQRRAWINAKRATPNRKSLDARSVITDALIQRGGVYDTAAQDAVAMIAQAQAADAGTSLTIDEAMDRLAVDASMLAAAIDEAKAVTPEDFFDVSKIDRLPENRRLIGKMQYINRRTADRGAVARLTERIQSRHAPKPI